MPSRRIRRPRVSGRRMKLNYMTQPKARPPTFVLFAGTAATASVPKTVA